MEILRSENMMKNHSLAGAIGDIAWYQFTQFIKYKSEWKGCELVQIGSFEPSTKLCSMCGQRNNHLKLSDREWDCDNCGSHHDRDVNAAINILTFSQKHSGRVTAGEDVGLPTLVGAMKRQVNLII